MVTIIDYAKRQNAEGKDFYVLILQGGIEMVRSQTSGEFYATARKASMTCTFDEATCKTLLGTQIEGEIVKVASSKRTPIQI